MYIFPPLTLTLLNGFLLIIPLLVLRFGVPAAVNKKAGAKLDYTPQVKGFERTALTIYYITTGFLILSPVFARIRTGTVFSTIGWAVYVLGLILLTVSLLHFSRDGGIITHGVYRYSRNPIYIGYFLIFLGVSLLIGSWFYLGAALIYQYSVHWLILSEERWCREQFGASYAEYERKVRRYL